MKDFVAVPASRGDSRRSDIRAISVAIAGGVAYIAAVVGTEEWSWLAMHSNKNAPLEVARSSGWLSAIAVAVLLPAFLSCCWAVRRGGAMDLPTCSNAWLTNLSAVIGGGVFAILGDATRLLPFWWRHATDADVEFGLRVIGQGSWLPIILILVAVGIMRPFIEEAFVRFGLLQLALRLRVRPVLAVIVTSAIFVALHPTHAIPQLVGLFWLGIICATMTLAKRGRVTLAVSVHAGYNVVANLSFWSALIMLSARSPHGA